MSKGDIFWLAMVGLCMIIALAAATEGRWLTVGVFILNAAWFVTVIVQSRRRRGRQLYAARKLSVFCSRGLSTPSSRRFGLSLARRELPGLG